MKDLIGKKVKLIAMMGDTSVSFEGILSEVDQWIVIESKGKKRIINRDAVVYVEER
ncbi:MAG: hypothetical protein QXS37_00535 [Candidatus Aenigmatarchaeota archaeon]